MIQYLKAIQKTVEDISKDVKVLITKTYTAKINDIHAVFIQF